MGRGIDGIEIFGEREARRDFLHRLQSLCESKSLSIEEGKGYVVQKPSLYLKFSCDNNSEHYAATSEIRCTGNASSYKVRGIGRRTTSATGMTIRKIEAIERQGCFWMSLKTKDNVRAVCGCRSTPPLDL